MADKLKQVTVKGAGSDDKVVLWERHADHPDGEVLVYNNGQSYTVAETARVKRLVTEGALVEGDAGEVRERNELRRATEEEKDAANLRTETERNTAVVRDTNKPADVREVRRNT